MTTTMMAGLMRALKQEITAALKQDLDKAMPAQKQEHEQEMAALEDKMASALEQKIAAVKQEHGKETAALERTSTAGECATTLCDCPPVNTRLYLFVRPLRRRGTRSKNNHYKTITTRLFSFAP
jgi:low affinity Fe/Cu permease